jgi:hypothetical protein
VTGTREQCRQNPRYHACRPQYPRRRSRPSRAPAALVTAVPLAPRTGGALRTRRLCRSRRRADDEFRIPRARLQMCQGVRTRRARRSAQKTSARDSKRSRISAPGASRIERQ